MKKLLFVDDEEFYRTLIPIALKALFDVQTACDADQAADILESECFDVVMTDYVMGEGYNGIWLLGEVKKKQPDALRIMFSGSEPDEFEEHLKSGIRTLDNTINCCNPLPFTVPSSDPDARHSLFFSVQAVRGIFPCPDPDH